MIVRGWEITCGELDLHAGYPHPCTYGVTVLPLIVGTYVSFSIGNWWGCWINWTPAKVPLPVTGGMTRRQFLCACLLLIAAWMTRHHLARFARAFEHMAEDDRVTEHHQPAGIPIEIFGT